MGLLDDVQADDAAAFTDPDVFGESVVYVKGSGGERTINAVVFRNLPESVGEVYVPDMEIEVANNATTGIAASEISFGADYVRLVYRLGETAEPYIIVGQCITQDHGMIRLALGKTP